MVNSSYGNADNNYFGSIGTTTDILQNNSTSVASLASVPTTGLFAFQQSKRDAVIDGTSNTVAFTESTVSSTSTAVRQKLMGLTSVSLPATSVLLNAFSNLDGVKSGIAACDPAWNGGKVTNDVQRGDNWVHGAMAMTLFNTVVTPNGESSQWAYCSATRDRWPISATPTVTTPGESAC